MTIVDKPKAVGYYNATLTLCIPTGTVFESVNIETGAAKLTVDTLTARSLKLKLGAGDVRFDSLNASSDVDIEGGTGHITVADGTLNNLTLNMGVGNTRIEFTEE